MILKLLYYLNIKQINVANAGKEKPQLHRTFIAADYTLWLSRVMMYPEARIIPRWHKPHLTNYFTSRFLQAASTPTT